MCLGIADDFSVQCHSHLHVADTGGAVASQGRKGYLEVSGSGMGGCKVDCEISDCRRSFGKSLGLIEINTYDLLSLGKSCYLLGCSCGGIHTVEQ